VKLRIETAEVFKPLLQPARYKGAWGGRGSGKSQFFADLGVEQAMMIPGFRLLCAREVQKSLKQSVKRLIEDKIAAHGLRGNFNVLDDRIVTPGDGVFTFIGMQDHTADTVKSYEGYHAALFEEAQTASKRSLEMLRPTIRAENSELWFPWNPRNKRDPIDMLLRGSNPPPRSVVVRANYTDNPWFPRVLEEEREYDRIHNPKRYAHIWLGDYEPEIEGAIFNRADFHDHRVEAAPKLDRIAVALDHATSAEDDSNEHGIIVGGVNLAQKHAYILDDLTIKGSPLVWAERVVHAFDRYDANAIIIERNQGGDMIRHTLNSVRRGLPIIEVTATKGKQVRAAPVASLYALGRVHHVGTFEKLEDQFCQMTAAGYEGEGSPDRVDAGVWLVSYLMPQIQPTSKTSGQTFKANTDFEV
tara:strand:- start:24853 stop:26097 length:1245 start_codon:yes stop_codon:yes gene_type:complete